MKYLKLLLVEIVWKCSHTDIKLKYKYRQRKNSRVKSKLDNCKLCHFISFKCCHLEKTQFIFDIFVQVSINFKISG